MGSLERLYYGDSRRARVEAGVLSLTKGDEGPILELDRATLFPGGGGQPADTGWVDGTPVARVFEEGERAFLELAATLAVRPGDRVEVEVDASRRLDFAQQHTAEHLLAAVALRLVGARSVSVHFGPERSLVDLDAASMGEGELDAVEEEVERLVAADLPIRTHLCPPEDPSSFALRRAAPEGEDELRVVEIEGIDFTPCCGVHLRSTGELRAVRLLGAERYKGMTRVHFLAGARATADYRGLARASRECARILGCSEGELASAVAREAGKRAAAERALGELTRRLAAEEAAAALAEARASAAARRAAGSGPGRPPVALRRYPDRGADSLMETAKAFAAAGMTALLASAPDLTVQAVAPEGGPRLGERLKTALSASGGRGGGGPASFRAVFADAASLDAFLAAAESELSG